MPRIRSLVLVGVPLLMLLAIFLFYLPAMRAQEPQPEAAAEKKVSPAGADAVAPHSPAASGDEDRDTLPASTTVAGDTKPQRGKGLLGSVRPRRDGKTANNKPRAGAKPRSGDHSAGDGNPLAGARPHADSAPDDGNPLAAAKPRRGDDASGENNSLAREKSARRAKQRSDGNPLGADAGESAAAPSDDNSDQPARTGGERGQVLLKLAQIRDPGMENIVSHTVLVPKGWEVKGGVFWTPGLKPFVHAQLAVVAPDGREVNFLPSQSRSFGEYPPAVRQQMEAQGQMPKPGAPQFDGTLWTPPPNDIASFVVGLLQQGRPAAGRMKVVGVEKLPTVVSNLTEAYQPLMDQLEANRQQNAQLGMETSVWIDAEVVKLEYEENGQRFHEEVGCGMALTMTRMHNPGIGESRQYFWTPYFVGALRAPVGEYEQNEALFSTIIGSFRQTPQWGVKVHEIRMQIAQIEHKGRMERLESFRKTQEQIAKNNSEISDSQMASWRKDQESGERIQRNFTNTINEVDDYRLPDGGSVSLSSHYDRVFTNGNDEYLLTNDASFDPALSGFKGEWQTIEPIKPAGGAGNE